jgi:MFS family permease
MSPWTVYWITRLDNIHVAAICILVPLVIIGGVTATIASVERDLGWLSDKFWRKVFLWGVSVLIFLSLCIALVPTTKEAIAIYALPKIVNNEKVQQIPENAVYLINRQMEAWLKDLGGKDEK